MFINSGTADCESLQGIYGPKIEANQSDSTYLKKAISILKMMKCTESEAYFQASYYMYKIDPTADAATGCGYMAYKKGDYDTAMVMLISCLHSFMLPARIGMMRRL